MMEILLVGNCVVLIACLVALYFNAKERAHIEEARKNLDDLRRALQEMAQ